MSTTFDLATVTHSIASLSISGVVTKDTHEIVDSLGLGFAILCPRPSDFITNFQVISHSNLSNIIMSYTNTNGEGIDDGNGIKGHNQADNRESCQCNS